MAGHSMVTSEAEVYALKETLWAQQELMQKLYNELDAEREASATAASEALSVILRLQGEKAAIKMEAEQYKRLAEEKITHAEESFAIIEDIIQQREMEVAALEYQVQSYRYKLLSMGYVDPGCGDMKFPENLLQLNESLAGDTSFHNLARRNSAPILVKCKRAMFEREGSSPEMDDIPKSVEEQTGQEVNELTSDLEKKTDNSTHGKINSLAEQIRKLNIRIKEIAGANDGSSRGETRSPSSFSSRPSAGNLCNLSNAAHLQNETLGFSPEISFGSPYNSTKIAAVKNIQQTTRAENSPGKGVVVDSPCSPNVHDVFEVPQGDRNCRSNESSTRGKKKTAFEADEKLESKDLIQPEAVKQYAKDEHDWLKKLLQSIHDEKHLFKPSDIAAIDRAIAQPTTSAVAASEASLDQVNRISKVNEVETLVESASREEELKLLKEIKEKLNIVHDEIMSQTEKKSSTRNVPCLPLPEAMLHFWL